mgnify:CR=1 FL=1
MESNSNDNYVLVLEDRTEVKNKQEAGKLSVVSSVDEKGNLKTTEAGAANQAAFLKFNNKDGLLKNFMTNFLKQFNNPTHFGLYKVLADNVEQGVDNLRTMLQSRERLESKQQLAEMGISFEDYLPHQKNATAIDPEKVDWKMLDNLGLSRERLEQSGELEKMLNWQKSNLLTIAVPIGDTTIYTEARLAFRTDESGNIGLAIHPLRKEPQLDFPYMGYKLSPEEKTELKLNVVGKIPDLFLDNTDRNRTSPFAFTGNKFEFRAVGSRANCGKPMMVLNTIVAKQLRDFKQEVDTLIEQGTLKKDEAIFNVLREYIKQSKAIRFEGDGYSKAWEKEAAKRGLSNHKTTPEALRENLSDQAIALFEEMGVLSRVELEARYEIALEEYVKTVQIESRIIGDIARNHVVPTAVRYLNTLIENVKGLKEIFSSNYEAIASEQIELIKRISEHIRVIHSKVNAMIEMRKHANALSSFEQRAEVYCHQVLPFFEEIRYHADKLELMVDDELWTLTKYRELFFS